MSGSTVEIPRTTRIARRSPTPVAEVTGAPLAGPLPYLLTPRDPELDLVAWAAGHPRELESLLLTHRALLFRGFRVDETSERLARFVARTSAGALSGIPDESTPRTKVSDGVFTSTSYPAHQSIHLHNECSYHPSWPRKLYFACLVAPAAGGETPIADVRRVSARIRPALFERFAELGVRYVRHFHPSLGLSWQRAFSTEERSEVERYCRASGTEWEWRSGDRLRTSQLRPAVRVHPESGERLWFNHGAFFHVAALEPTVRQGLQDALGEDLPSQTFFGDGSPIADEDARHLLAAYASAKVTFAWEAGDILLLDNMTVAHGREPFQGARRVVVAMADLLTDVVGPSAV